MKKQSYSALLLLLISFASFAQPKVHHKGYPSPWSHRYQNHYADTAESPDEFMRPPLRELRR
ncbi:hypothetical protein [Rosenbergiella metrosideri]|uniref:hypothetical protein n=1 Tax=Rosenbergiella metrosideri TaxID=2921185 RepID=UPI001F50223D|nr:hypothetical protein [Rosenbergiella metrosideri]